MCSPSSAKSADSFSLAPVSNAALPLYEVSQLSLQITFCRYESGKLVKAILNPRVIQYVAISHIWGTAKWRQIMGVEAEVVASNEKAKFIAERLPSIVEGHYFWMDILCIDQRDSDARIAVTQHIPTIFRYAQKTVMVRDSSGFRNCCVEATGSLSNFFTQGERSGSMNLSDHLLNAHMNEVFNEGALTRLWPLQEVILSDKIQFVRCEKVADDIAEPQSKLLRVGNAANALLTFAFAWCLHGNPDGLSYPNHQMHIKFVTAFLTCCTVERPQSDRSGEVEIPTATEILLHRNSMRLTSKSRDFILAIMPQYKFYTIPPNAKQMTFTQLFFDCICQLRETENGLAPLLTRRIDVINATIANMDMTIPEPACLGDLVKLFNGPMVKHLDRHIEVTLVQVGPPIDPDVVGRLKENFGEEHLKELKARNEEHIVYVIPLVHLIVGCISHSVGIWKMARQELEQQLLASRSDNIRGPEPDTMKRNFMLATSALLIMSQTPRLGRTDYQQAVELRKYDILMTLLMSVPYNMVILLAAMIGCGLGLSAFEWAKENLTPLRVDLGGTSLLALSPNSVVKTDTLYMIVRAGDFPITRLRTIQRWALLAQNPSLDEDFNLCVFPPDATFDGEVNISELLGSVSLGNS
jgi:hypothetical protein